MTTARDVLVPVALFLGVLAIALIAVGLTRQSRAQRAAYYSERRSRHGEAARSASAGVLVGTCALLVFAASTLFPGGAGQAPSTSADLPATVPPTSIPVALAPTKYVAAATPVIDPPTRVPPGLEAAAARMVFRSIASGVDGAGLPIGAGTEFTRSIAAVYLFYEYSGVAASSRAQHAWFRNGGLVFTSADALTGIGHGSGQLVWRPGRPFDPGQYEVRVSLNDQPQFVANFVVR